MNYRFNSINPIQLLIGLAFIILLLGGLFFVAQGIFLVLMYLSPVLLLASLIMDYKVVINYGKWLVRKFNKNILSGVTWSLVTLFGFPVVAAILCVRAWTSYQLGQQTKERPKKDGEYIDYEIVDEEEEAEYIEIPESFRRR